MATLRNMYHHAIGKNYFVLMNAYKIERVRSHIRFIKRCLFENLIPNGFRVQDKLVDTLKNACTDDLIRTQSRQWMRLALNSLYSKLSLLQVPMVYTFKEWNNIERYKYLLRCVKRNKLQRLTDSESEPNDNETDIINKPFQNLSSSDFSPNQLEILNRGPNYVPSPEPVTDQTLRRVKANVQSAFNRLRVKDELLATTPATTEFLAGVVRVYESAKLKQEPTRQKGLRRTLQTIDATVKSNDVVMINSDKTTRLIAMDGSQYVSLVKDSLNSEDEVVRKTQPSTMQAKINRKLTEIAQNYRDSELEKRILSCKCSEPLPSIPYALPKDHKPGNLRGRPIISSIDSGVRKTQKFLSDLLQPLVERFIPTHLTSTSDFTNRLSSFNPPPDNDFVFASLDIVNLYGSIPLQAEGTLDLLSCLREFFETFHMNSSASQLSWTDLESMFLMAGNEDVYIMEGNFYKQKMGIAMGNNAAPAFASIFIHYIERQILQSEEILFWCRYVDDIFLIYRQGYDIMNVVNGIHPNIQFTLEESTDGSLPFLDTMVKWCSESRTFSFTLFIKPVHSNSCLPFSSHVPVNRKRSLLIGENWRATRNSSSSSLVATSKSMLRRRFIANGYPQRLVKTFFDGSPQAQREDKENPTSFIRLPFVDEASKRHIMKLVRDCDLLDKVRVIFQTEKPLCRRWRRKREKPVCEASCWSCQIAVKTGKCYWKHVVYQITCDICSKLYIGQTERTMRSRLREHVQSEESAVYQHSTIAHQTFPSETIHWKILEVERNNSLRKSLESLYIKSYQSSLMNNCEGSLLLPFL